MSVYWRECLILKQLLQWGVMNMINGIKVLNWGTLPSVLLHVDALGEKREQLLRYRGTVVIVAQTENTIH